MATTNLGELIEKLQVLKEKHGPDTDVYLNPGLEGYDEDTYDASYFDEDGFGSERVVIW